MIFVIQHLVFFMIDHLILIIFLNLFKWVILFFPPIHFFHYWINLFINLVFNYPNLSIITNHYIIAIFFLNLFPINQFEIIFKHQLLISVIQHLVFFMKDHLILIVFLNLFRWVILFFPPIHFFHYWINLFINLIFNYPSLSIITNHYIIAIFLLDLFPINQFEIIFKNQS